MHALIVPNFAELLFILQFQSIYHIGIPQSHAVQNQLNDLHIVTEQGNVISTSQVGKSVAMQFTWLAIFLEDAHVQSERKSKKLHERQLGISIRLSHLNWILLSMALPLVPVHKLKWKKFFTMIRATTGVGFTDPPEMYVGYTIPRNIYWTSYSPPSQHRNIPYHLMLFFE